MNGWHEIAATQIRTFQLEDDPEIFHLIPAGSPGMYLVVFEDGYDMLCLSTKPLLYLTKEEVEEKFKIKI